MVTNYRLRDGVVAQLELREAVLLDTASGDYYDLNATGTLLLRALLDGASLELASAEIAAAFDVDGERARSDCAAVLAELLACRLIEPDPTA